MPKRGKLALAACEPCRRKKVRCDGTRPVCGACSDKSSQCTFASLPGLTRTAALKSEVSQLKTNNRSLLELYWQLKHGSASHAYAIVEQIRSEERMIDVPSPANIRPRNDYGLPTGASEPMDSSNDVNYVCARKHSATTASSECERPTGSEYSSDYGRGGPLSPLAGVQARGGHSQESTTTTVDSSSRASLPQNSWAGSHFATHYNGNSDTLLRHSLQSRMASIRKGFELQRSFIAELFFCYEPEAFEELFANLSRDPVTPIASSVLCEMCAVAVTSGQYVRDLIEPGVLDHWYDAARQQFDDCIESSPANAIKVSTLLGLCNVVNKSTVAIAYFEMGLGLAATYIQQQTGHGVDAPAEELSEVFRIQKSLAFCNGWLQATLGYVPATTAEQGGTLEEAKALPFAGELDMVHDAVSVIAILKAKVMGTLRTCSDVSGLLGSIQSLQGQLRDWYGRLPREAHLERLSTDAHFTLKTSVYNLHLLHLGAVMLIFRHCLAGLQDPGNRETLSLEQKCLMNGALSDGLLAAQQSARMSDIIGRASQSTRHCWITIYQAYVSGMILIYHAAQLMIAGFSEEHWTKSFESAKKVVDVLEFCKKLDPVARRFFTSLLRHYEHVQQLHASTTTTSGRDDIAGPQPDDYLFVACPKNTSLYRTSIELSRQLCNPYADEGTMSPQQRDSTVLQSDTIGIPKPQRTPQEEEMRRTLGSQSVRGTMKPVIPNFENGYFVGSSEPSGWLAKRTCATYSSEAMALDVP